MFIINNPKYQYEQLIYCSITLCTLLFQKLYLQSGIYTVSSWIFTPDWNMFWLGRCGPKRQSECLVLIFKWRTCSSEFIAMSSLTPDEVLSFQIPSDVSLRSIYLVNTQTESIMATILTMTRTASRSIQISKDNKYSVDQTNIIVLEIPVCVQYSWIRHFIDWSVRKSTYNRL